MTVPLEVRHLSAANKLMRLGWGIVWLVLFRPTPRVLHGWRRFLLRLFGAKLARRTSIYPSVQIWAPWQLEMHEGSCLSPYVDCYNVDRVVLGRKATVSQYSYLCTATRDYNTPGLPMVSAPIVIEEEAWVTAQAYVGPGITVGRGAVVGACSVVTRDVEDWMVVVGNPARAVRRRDKERFHGKTSGSEGASP
jgi:putative colanic acid biosynthesis acetyltransferase WcaF